MGQITVSKCPIEGLYIIEPTVHGDNRGYFMETYNRKDMEEAGLNMVFVQDNQSMSTKGVLRGLHTQKKYPQGKLVRVIRGRVFDVAVDVRPGSETYGKWYGVELTEENKKQFYISEGFAHGFLVLSDVAEFCYKVTDFYHPEDEMGIAWNDPDIAVAWPEVVGSYSGSASGEGYTLAEGVAALEVMVRFEEPEMLAGGLSVARRSLKQRSNLPNLEISSHWRRTSMLQNLSRLVVKTSTWI